MIDEGYLDFIRHINRNLDICDGDDTVIDMLVDIIYEVNVKENFNVLTRYGLYENIKVFRSKNITRYILEHNIKYIDLPIREMLETIDIGLIILENKDDNFSIHVYTKIHGVILDYFDKTEPDFYICQAIEFGSGPLSLGKLQSNFNIVKRAKAYIKIRHKFNDLKDLLSIEDNIFDYLINVYSSVDILGSKVTNTVNIQNAFRSYLSNDVYLMELIDVKHNIVYNSEIYNILKDIQSECDCLPRSERTLEMFQKVLSKYSLTSIELKHYAEKNKINESELIYHLLKGETLESATKALIQEQETYNLGDGKLMTYDLEANKLFWESIISEWRQ